LSQIAHGTKHCWHQLSLVLDCYWSLATLKEEELHETQDLARLLLCRKALDLSMGLMQRLGLQLPIFANTGATYRGALINQTVRRIAAGNTCTLSKNNLAHLVCYELPYLALTRDNLYTAAQCLGLVFGPKENEFSEETQNCSGVRNRINRLMNLAMRRITTRH
jgi:hypothetical protein